MKKIMFIFGTRPEFIKLYPLIVECQKNTLETIVVNTGQHQEMLDEMMEAFQIQEQYDLDIMHRCNGLSDILCETLKGLDPIITQEQPDLIVVHGDTSATFAGALQAAYHQVPVAHVEAGLRTFNKYSPFPEELNRQMTGIIADLHFTPTTTTEANLLAEGKPKDRIFVVGNSAIDMLQYTLDDQFTHPLMEFVGTNKLLLATIHRRENLENLEHVFAAFNQICEEHDDVRIIYSMHMNPKIQEIAKRTLTSPHIMLINPLGVVEFHNLMKQSYLVMTDSGGIQEEAPAIGKPVLVMRDTTERPEGVEAGTLKLVGTDTETITAAARTLIENKDAYEEMTHLRNPYGDGQTCVRIVKHIQQFLEEK